MGGLIWIGPVCSCRSRASSATIGLLKTTVILLYCPQYDVWPRGVAWTTDNGAFAFGSESDIKSAKIVIGIKIIAISANNKRILFLCEFCIESLHINNSGRNVALNRNYHNIYAVILQGEFYARKNVVVTRRAA